MRYHISFALLLLFVVSCKNEKNPIAESNPQKEGVNEAVGPVKMINLTKAWATPSLLKTSESVLYNEVSNLYYISCIGNVPPTAEDGDGYIAMVAKGGALLKERWAEGLDAPKGMALYKNKLYVTDINDLVSINIGNGKIETRIPIPGATFLNDLAVGTDGKLYISDSNENTIYTFDGSTVELFLKDESLGGSNGLLIKDNEILVAGFMNGDVNTINIETKEITNRGKGIVPGGDGIAMWEDGYIFSNWNGEVYYLDAEWKPYKVMDTKAQKLNAADISINKKDGLLMVPTFFGNTAQAYHIESIR